jgi:hypothetical protein
MSLPRCPFRVACVVSVVLVFDACAYAQTHEEAAPMSTWVFGVSTGWWRGTRIQYMSPRPGLAFDGSVEYRLGPPHGVGDRAVRMQFGTGRGDEHREALLPRW